MNLNNKNFVLLIAGLLLAIGIFKPDFSSIIPSNRPSVVDIDALNLPAPSDALKPKASDVIKALSIDSDRKADGKRLASLYNDMATLVALDGDDEVIKNTKEIRQANTLVGLMLHLNIKGKYPDLPKSAQALVVEAIGDDEVLLNNDLRAKAVEAFKALAWACNEGSK